MFDLTETHFYRHVLERNQSWPIWFATVCSGFTSRRKIDGSLLSSWHLKPLKREPIMRRVQGEIWFKLHSLIRSFGMKGWLYDAKFVGIGPRCFVQERVLTPISRKSQWCRSRRKKIGKSCGSDMINTATAHCPSSWYWYMSTTGKTPWIDTMLVTILPKRKATFQRIPKLLLELTSPTL